MKTEAGPVLTRSVPRPGMIGSMDSVMALLDDKKKKLETELARLSAPPRDSAAISFGKRVGDGTSMAVDRLVDVAAHDKMRAQLEDVQRALEKISENSYGTCDGCGRPIAEERLSALPWAVLCVACAQGR
jgi:DnaK suppressor protein